MCTMAPGIGLTATDVHDAAVNIRLRNKQPTKGTSIEDSNSGELITSPYTDADHLLRLQTLDTQTQLFAKALTILHPTRADYATATYTDSFNWDEVFNLLRELSHSHYSDSWTRRRFYVVAFRSVLSPHADLEALHALDKHSHQEATLGGGLLKYWFGTRDCSRRNLATCMFSSHRVVGDSLLPFSLRSVLLPN